MLSIRAIRAMTLNARDGLTEDAIAAELGVSRTAVHRDLRRARDRYDATTTASAWARFYSTPDGKALVDAIPTPEPFAPRTTTRRRPRRKDARPEPMGLV
jgi:hypothetical protein